MREPCTGTDHWMPIPPGMTADDVEAEVAILGHLAAGYDGPRTWATIACPGGHACWCRHIEIAGQRPPRMRAADTPADRRASRQRARERILAACRQWLTRA